MASGFKPAKSASDVAPMSFEDASKFKMPFGPYKDYTLSEILDEHPGYLDGLWERNLYGGLKAAFATFMATDLVKRTIDKAIFD